MRLATTFTPQGDGNADGSCACSSGNSSSSQLATTFTPQGDGNIRCSLIKKLVLALISHNLYPARGRKPFYSLRTHLHRDL